LPNEEQLPLCRLRYLGTDTDWGFAIYQASSESYDDTLLPNGNPSNGNSSNGNSSNGNSSNGNPSNGNPSGTPEQALDCALGLYLSDPSAWINPPTD
jgi:hypothetical protein